jgi:hypothetical protein
MAGGPYCVESQPRSDECAAHRRDESGRLASGGPVTVHPGEVEAQSDWQARRESGHERVVNVTPDIVVDTIRTPSMQPPRPSNTDESNRTAALPLGRKRPRYTPTGFMSGLQSRSRGLRPRPDQFVELRGHSFVALGPDASDVQLPALPLCFPAQSLAQRQSTPESARLSHNYAQLPGF